MPHTFCAVWLRMFVDQFVSGLVPCDGRRCTNFRPSIRGKTSITCLRVAERWASLGANQAHIATTLRNAIAGSLRFQYEAKLPRVNASALYSPRPFRTVLVIDRPSS